MLRLIGVAVVLFCCLSLAIGEQPAGPEIDSFVSKLTPQQQSEQLALARTAHYFLGESRKNTGDKTRTRRIQKAS